MRKRYLLVALSMLAVLIVLVAANPVWQQMQSSIFPKLYWILVYCAMTFAASFVAFMVAPVVTKPLHHWGLPAASFASALVTALLLSVYSYWVGTKLTAQEADSLIFQDLNHFFRNHRSAVFMFVEAPIIGLISGLFVYFWNKSAEA